MIQRSYSKVFNFFLVLLLIISLVTVPLPSLGHAEELSEIESIIDSDEMQSATSELEDEVITEAEEKSDTTLNVNEVEDESIPTDAEFSGESGDRSQEWATLDNSLNDNGEVIDISSVRDSTPPTVESVEISPKEVNVGDVITIKAKIVDDQSGVKSSSISFNSPSENSWRDIHLKENKDTGYWEYNYTVQEHDEAGKWQFMYLFVVDNAGNNKAYDHNEIEGDLYFNVLDEGNDSVDGDDGELPYRIVTSNETWSNRVIDKDVFIGPEAILSINGNVTVNGDIYVYGALRSLGGLMLNGTLHAQQINFGTGGTLYQGSAHIGGSNSISSMNVSSQAYDVPLDVDYEILEQNDELIIKGRTLPFLDVSVNGKKIDVMDNGDFSIQLSNYNNIVPIVVKDIFGKTVTKHLNLGLEEIIAEEVIKEMPFETIREEDPNLEKGKEVVEQEGMIGEKVIFYEITYFKGEEIKREVIGEEVRIQPADEIIRIGTKVTEIKEEIEQKEIPYETIKKEDSDLEKDKEMVVQQGVTGEKVTIYEVTFVNGKEINREIKSEEIIREPVEEIIRVGTKVMALKNGDRDEAVVHLKLDLAKAGFKVPGNGTTLFGAQTEKQVKAFQKYYGLNVNGTFDKNTESKLKQIVNSPLQNGKNHKDTVQLKRDLAEAGFKVPGKGTTLYGKQTEKQVKAFQKKHGLVQNGIADEITLKKLNAVANQPLSNGMKNQKVVQLKKNLAKAGFKVPGNGTTLFGAQTEKQVDAFQKYYGLNVNGTFDKNTEAKLKKVVNSPLQNGKKHKDTVQLKRDLAKAGFKVPGKGTTLYGKQTEKQVKAFQKKHGLVQNGIADEVTLKKLNEVVNQPLSNGMKHQKVVQLKKDLAKAGFEVPGKGTSLFGAQTEKQVKAFQKYYGLNVNGTFDKNTEAKLKKVVNSPLQNGKKHKDTVQLKKDLAKAGFKVPGKGTTLYGKQTEKQVKAFQKKHGLVQNGIADEVTLNKLNSVLSQK